MPANSTYILDANVMIQAANVYYQFGHVQGFWDWLETECLNKVVRTVSLVADEVDFPPELVEWIEDREADGIYLDVSDPDIQAEYQQMAAWIIGQDYGPAHVAKFLDGADLWIIATASVEGHVVVTQEQAVAANSKKIKIPNICEQFDVECIDTFELIRQRGAKI